MVIQIKDCMRGCECDRFFAPISKYWWINARAIAVMFRLVGEVSLYGFDADTPDTPCKITSRPERRFLSVL